jgi:hypothetical protein
VGDRRMENNVAARETRELVGLRPAHHGCALRKTTAIGAMLESGVAKRRDRAASAARNVLKRFFRGPFASSGYRIYSPAEKLAEYGSDEALRAAAGRTNPFWDAAADDVVAGVAANANRNCGCR